MSTHQPKRWQQPSRVVAYITDTCDDKGDPSLVKMLCIGLAIVCIFDMRTNKVGAANSALAIVCIATAFGRSTFLAWLNRYTSTNVVSADFKTNTDIKVDAAEVVKALRARDPATGVDPS